MSTLLEIDGMEFAPDGIDTRLNFRPETEVLEIDLGHLHFRNSASVNAFCDRLEDRIHLSGKQAWLFMINYRGCKIEPEALIAFVHRGKALNLAHSMGTVRHDASPETRRQIERAAEIAGFDPNFFATRNGALAHIAKMPSTRRGAIAQEPNYARADLEPRIEFLLEDQIMDVNFSDFTFHHACDVDDFCDFIEALIKATGQKWYFLINYSGTRIEPAAWVQFARRGKRLNISASLGTVRYAVGPETERDIRMRAESQSFRPNIVRTRAEALARIAEIRAGR